MRCSMVLLFCSLSLSLTSSRVVSLVAVALSFCFSECVILFFYFLEFEDGFWGFRSVPLFFSVFGLC